MKRHVETSIFRKISEAVDYGRQFHRAVSISGAPGLGKTHSLTWIKAREPLAAYWSVPTARATMKAATQGVLVALGHQTEHEHTAALWEQLEYVLQGAQDGEFLIIDEAHRLPLNILVDFVDIPERYGVAVIIAGNPELLKRTRVNTAAFEQIASRCAKRVTLEKPSRDDLNIIAADFDVIKDDRSAAIAYGRNTSIRALIAMLETARGLADRGPVRIAELRQAAVLLGGGTGALSFSNRPRNWPQPA